MVEAIRRLKSGRRVIHTTHDPFHGVPDGIPVKVDVEVDTQAATIFVDLTDNPDCQPCGLNLTESTPISAAMVGIYNGILDHHVPANAGSFRRVTVKVRENCAVGLPRHPFPASSRRRTWPTECPTRRSERWQKSRPVSVRPRPAPSSRWAWE
jgi:N-methylhydantoinase B/oxoprolinase/acetone carboxylase alpha subunit